MKYDCHKYSSLSLSLSLSFIFSPFFSPIFRSWADLIDNGIEFGRFVWEIKIKREREREKGGLGVETARTIFDFSTGP